MIPLLLVSSDRTKFEAAIDAYLGERPELEKTTYAIYPEEGKSISIEQIRELKRELVVASDSRLVVLYDFHTAKPEAQNAMLKTLEDQAESNQFIVCTNHIGAILPTIISRCKIVSADAGIPMVQTNVSMQNAVDDLLSSNSYAFLNDELFQAGTIEDAKEVFKHIIFALRTHVRQGDVRAARLTSQALALSSLLRSNNLNPQLAIDSWCILAKKTIPKN